jgi:hypothetical protein
MDERTAKLLEPTNRRPDVSEGSLKRLRRAVSAELPAEYLEFLRWSDGAKGPMRPYLPLIAERLTDAPHGSDTGLARFGSSLPERDPRQHTGREPVPCELCRSTNLLLFQGAVQFGLPYPLFT